MPAVNVKLLPSRTPGMRALVPAGGASLGASCDLRRGQVSPSFSRPRHTDVLRFGERYADLRDRHLADALIMEDAAEEQESLSPHERITCHFHRRWAHECIGSPVHVIPVTGHRWCRRCEAEATVAVDELTGSVAVTCPRCRQELGTPATRQIVRTCRASMAAACEHRRAHSEADRHVACTA